MKKTMTIELPTKANMVKATESIRACQTWLGASGGITSAVVLPISAETGTIV
jgi:hypothetical protein